MEYYLNRSWAEVDLDALDHNVQEIRKILSPRTEMMGVVKADAYGHGVLEIAHALIAGGVERLAVSMLDEAIQLRQNGVRVPILVLSYTDPARAAEILRYEVTQAVFSHDLAQALSEAAVRMKRDVRIHIKLDTGMSRVGFMPGYSAVKHVLEISRLPRVIVEGIFTHFASADEEDPAYTRTQFERFTSVVQELNRVGLYIPLRHAANSAATLMFPEMHLNIVRPGVILYGMYPSEEVRRATPLRLRPVMSLKANITLVKDVEPGTPVSYGRIFTTGRPTRLATLPVGYADGYTRLLSGKGQVLINGQRAPVVGRICMDQCMADITDLQGDVNVGDEAVIFGRQGDGVIPVEELAAHMGTINYEVVCLIGKRIPRVYVRGGQVEKILNYLI